MHSFDQAVFSIFLFELGVQCQTDARFWANRGNNRQPDAPNGVTLDPRRTNNVVLYSRRGWGVDYDHQIGQPYAHLVQRRTPTHDEI